MASDELDALFDEFVHEWMKDRPVSATYLGYHHYDHLLGSIGAEFRRYRRRKNERYYGRLKEYVNDDTLSRDQEIDLKLLLKELENAFFYEDKIRNYERYPSIAVNAAMGGLNIFIIRPSASTHVKLENMLSRLNGVPRLFDEGKANMRINAKDIPPLWVNTTIDSLDGGANFFIKTVPDYARDAGYLHAEIKEASMKANESLQNYKAFLKDEILPEAKGEFACGKEIYEYILKNDYLLPYGSEDLVRIGEKVIDETEKRLESLASEIAPGRKWQEVTASLKGNHPEEDRLLDFYKGEVLKLRKFIVEKDIVDIPDGEKLSIIDTPSYNRKTVPYAAYFPPAPFEDEKVGCFYVTPVNKGYSPERQAEQLEGHNRYKAALTALHEGYPGHHLQLVYASKVKSTVRKLFADTVFGEGYAMYCEELMVEEGYLTDPRYAIFQLKDQLWRAHRVLIDVGLHTGGMTFDQAVDRLVDSVRIEKVNAIAEVKRYAQSPTQPMSYTIGKLLIKELREDYKRRMGGAYTLKGFHNQLLSYGTLPVRIIRDEMLGGIPA